MKDNLENGTNEMNNILMEQLATKVDLNSAFNELIKSLEGINIKTNEEFAQKFLESFQKIMDEKHKNLKNLLDDFEKQIYEIQKPEDSNFDYEITKITSDINAIYSKMEDQEKQFSNLIKSFDAIAKNETKKDFDELRSDLEVFAKGFGSSANVLIKNLNDFMDNMKEYSGKEEFNKLFDNLEILSNNTSIIMSAIHIIDTKYKDMTDVVELITGNENAFKRTLEELRESKTSFDSVTPSLKLLSTKEDLDIVHKQLDILNEAFIETKKYIEAQSATEQVSQYKEKQNEIALNIETLQNNLSTLNSNLINLANDIGEKFSSEENSFKNYYSELTDKINNILSENKALFDEGVGIKISSMEENINKTAQENFVKIYNNLNDNLNSFENSIKERDTENKNTVVNSINILQEEIGAIIDSIKMLRDGFASLNNNFIESLQEPIKNALESVDTQNIETKVTELSNTLSETISEFKNAFDNFGENLISNTANQTKEEITKINSSVESSIQNINTIKEDFEQRSEANKIEIKSELNNILNKLDEFINQYNLNKENENNILKDEILKISDDISQSVSSMKDKLSNAPDKEFIKELNDDLNIKNQESLQNLSNTINDNIENININTLREFASNKENLNIIEKLLRDELSSQTLKINSLDEKMTSESKLACDNITAAFQKNASNNNALISDALTTIIEKITDISDFANTNLNRIEEKITSIPQDLNDGQITILTDEFGNMTNKLELINMQQINNSKELMIELQNLLGKDEEKSSSLAKIIQNTDLIHKIEEKIEASKISNAEHTAMLSDKIEETNSKNANNFNILLEELNSIKIQNDKKEEKSNAEIESIKENFEKQSEDIKTKLDDYAHDLTINNQQNEVFQNNFSEEVKDMFEKQTKIFSAAFQKTLNAQNPKDFSLALERIYSKINTIANASKEEDNEYDYTLKDVESDLAKLRLILEKNPNLEVTQHLSALRGTINDTVKINQNVDQQLSYVNNWLRTAAKTMEILARKVDKAEKSNNDLGEIKVLLENQNTQPKQDVSIDTTDIEHALANTFKKFKIQEMKLESIEDKINSFMQRTNEEPDIKGFISVLYDNMAQTKALSSRMDSIELQLNGIQRNMEKIITYIEE